MLLDHIQNVSPMLLNPGGVNQRTQRAHCPALLADDLPHVGLRDANLDARRTIALNFTHIDGIAIIDKSFHHQFDRVAHLTQSAV